MRFGLLMVVFGTLGILSGGRVADALGRRGYADAKLRVGLIAALEAAGFAWLYPLMPSGGVAMMLLALLLFFGAFPAGGAAAVIQKITPGEMRAQASALYLFVVNLIGLRLGPTAVALVTDFVFGRDAPPR